MPGWSSAAIPALAAVLLLAGLTGCGGGGGDVQITPLASPATAASSAVTLQPTPSPTTTLLTTPGAQQGMADFCGQAPNVSTRLPASVPAYPGAELRFSQSTSGSGAFGLCTRDPVAAVFTYYTSQLPASGWQQIHTASIQNVQQLSATRGSGQLTVFVEPDAQVSGITAIIITTTGL
jgi:hypothetical protein